eukprot:1178291-Prorocentrum_minimum.AAC.1
MHTTHQTQSLIRWGKHRLAAAPPDASWRCDSHHWLTMQVYTPAPHTIGLSCRYIPLPLTPLAHDAGAAGDAAATVERGGAGEDAAPAVAEWLNKGLMSVWSPYGFPPPTQVCMQVFFLLSFSVDCLAVAAQVYTLSPHTSGSQCRIYLCPSGVLFSAPLPLLAKEDPYIPLPLTPFDHGAVTQALVADALARGDVCTARNVSDR